MVLLHPNLRIAYGNLERDISRTTYLIQTVQDILSTHYSQDTKSDNLDNATQGSVDIWVLYSVLS